MSVQYVSIIPSLYKIILKYFYIWFELCEAMKLNTSCPSLDFKPAPSTSFDA